MKRTKIVATIGPATSSLPMLEKLVKAGVNVFRLNFSHGSYESHGGEIDQIRKLAKKTGQDLPIILDTKGPEIRTKDLVNPIELKDGQKLILTVENTTFEKSGKIQVSYPEFIHDVSKGDKILVDGGVMNLQVIQKSGKDIICKVLDGGMLGSRRHLNLPGKKVSLDPVTDKDWEDIKFGIEKGVDFIAMSFVKHAGDIHQVREFLKKKKSKIEIIAKIETFEATQNLEAIIEASDQIMVARGDLGAEIPFAQVPRLQREIISLSAKYQKPVIVATQMLESMIQNPIPTRAEVTDVSQAVFQRTDATMLSGETTIGAFPVKSVQAMSNIILESEKSVLKRCEIRDIEADTDLSGLAKSATQLSEDIDDISAILVITQNGFTASKVSSYRPNVPIFAFTDNAVVCRKMNILWGVYPFQIKFHEPEKTVTEVKKEFLKRFPKFRGKKIILVSGSLVEGGFVPMVQIRQF